MEDGTPTPSRPGTDVLLADLGRDVCGGEERAGLFVGVCVSGDTVHAGSVADGGDAAGGAETDRARGIVCGDAVGVFHVRGIRISDDRVAVHDGVEFGICDGVERGAGAAAAGSVLGKAADAVDLWRGVCGAGGIVLFDRAGGGIAVPESRGCADVCGGDFLWRAHHSGRGVYAGQVGVGAERDTGGGMRVDGVGADGCGSGDSLAAGAFCVAMGIAGGDCGVRGVSDGGGVYGAALGAAIYFGEPCGDLVCAGAGVCGDYVVCDLA